MYVIKKLKLNKFVERPVASPSALFKQYGYSDPQFVSRETVENMEVSVPRIARKTQLQELAARMARKAEEFAENPANTKPLPDVPPASL